MTTPTLFTYVLFALYTLGVSGVHAKGSAADLARIRSAKGGALRSGSSASSRIGAPAVNVAPAPGKSVVFAPLSFKKDDFAVDGSKIPLLKEKVQDSYAGQLPVTADDGEKRKLFFWYWPTSANNGSDTLTIWLNGGPGCSSMTGLLSELGPFTYMPGADAPSVNKYAWSSVSDMLFVDQPVGTGFSNGTSDVRNEYDVADRFYGFLVAFYSTFPELLKKKLFISGESYAGFYIPYIAQRIIDASDEERKATPIDLQSILINDGVYSDFVIGEYAPTARWARKRNDVLKIPEDILKNVEVASEECGFEGLMDQASYPPKGPLLWDASTANSRTCWTFDTIYEAAGQVNSCFNIYDITQQCPTPVDPIEPYFNRPEVQELLHVPNYGNWSQCGGHGNIFPDNMDQSPYTETLFPGLIAALPRGVTLWHGLDDMILLAEGTRVTIQNMTWGGLQGFQSEPTQKLELDGKNYGVQHTERGLTYYEVVDAGHMVPADQPALSLEILKTVLGKGGNFVTSAASGTSSGSGSGSGSNTSTSANANGSNGGGNGGDDAAGRIGVPMITVAGVVAAFMMML